MWPESVAKPGIREETGNDVLLLTTQKHNGDVQWFCYMSCPRESDSHIPSNIFNINKVFRYGLYSGNPGI
jgi:hypothetical protein